MHDFSTVAELKLSETLNFTIFYATHKLTKCNPSHTLNEKSKNLNVEISLYI